MDKKAALIILDGWGYGSKDDSDGIHISKTPFFDSLEFECDFMLTWNFSLN